MTTQIGPAANYGAPFGIKLDKTGKIVAAGECDMGATGIDICVARYKAAEDE